MNLCNGTPIKMCHKLCSLHTHSDSFSTDCDGTCEGGGFMHAHRLSRVHEEESRVKIRGTLPVTFMCYVHNG